ncbi:MAG TPA: acylphosphatase [Candidatus Kapabacteria bacterium]|nr:acylphosphatase [Candidatus Kapabacteria bacterium]
MKRIHMIVRGLVQGVGFRYYTHRQAAAESVTGFVRNCSDGSVEIEAQGNEDAVNRLIEWVHRGVPRAMIENVQQQVIPTVAGEEEFDILL